MIIVTGAVGFIGSVLARELNSKGYRDLIIVDRLRCKDKWKNLRKVTMANYYHADEFFGSFSDGDWKKVKAIIHMGACSSTTETDADFLMKNNVEYSIKLWNKACTYNLPFIYASSAATYGDGSLGHSDEHTHTSKYLPLNPYGFSKQTFDQWALSQNKTPPFWAGLKFFNVYGPNEYHKEEMRSVVHKSFEQIKKDGKVRLFKSYKEGFKDGEQLRDFIYVKDVARWTLSILDLALKNLEIRDFSTKSGLYNMGTGRARSFLDLVKSVFKGMNVKENIEFIEMPESIRNQYQYFTEAPMHKLELLLGDLKTTSLEDGIKDYVTNHLLKDDPYL